MKIKELFKTTIAVAAFGLLMITGASCTDNDNDDNFPGGYQAVSYGVEDNSFTFNSNGLWSDANQSTPGNNLTINGMNYSRIYNVARETMYGFQPSRSTLTTVDENSTLSGVAYGALGYKTGAERKNYLVAGWDVSESTSSLPLQPCCRMWLANGKKFVPVGIYITNNALTYEKMKEKNAKCELLIYGVQGTTRTEPVKVTLCEPSQYGYDGIGKWSYVALDEFEQMDYLYFQMTADCGMENMPAYFCLVQTDALLSVY